MAENTRELVLDMLLEIEKNKVYSNQLMKAVLDKYNYLPVQEKRFIKRLAEGTIERRIELDYYLDAYSSVKTTKMKPLIRCLLRMSVYQILYMEAIPDSAVCNEAVKLAGKRKFQNLKGFVNGILRKITTEKNQLPLPDKKTECNLFLSVKYSMPLWIVEMWVGEYGYEVTEDLLEKLLSIHQVNIRFHTKLSEAERTYYINLWEQTGVVVTKSSYLPYCYEVASIDGIASMAGYEEGIFTVQDISSVLCVEAAGIGEKDIFMDVCSAPGGKSIFAAEKAKFVVCGDISEDKISKIRENATRMGCLDNMDIQIWDATIYREEQEESVDVLLLDVPCSGLGVIGKKRDIKYNITQEGLDSLKILQREIIANSWKYVKKGGTILYSTCTIRREENEEMCKWMLEELPIVPEDIEKELPAALLSEMKNNSMIPYEKLMQIGSVQLFPGVVNTDGFFFAKFKRV